jgi:hypothetical protein
MLNVLTIPKTDPGAEFIHRDYENKRSFVMADTGCSIDHPYLVAIPHGLDYVAIQHECEFTILYRCGFPDPISRIRRRND